MKTKCSHYIFMLAQRFESKTLRRQLNHLYFSSTYIIYTHYVNKCFNIYVHTQLCRLLSTNVIIPNYTRTFQSDVKQQTANSENIREGMECGRDAVCTQCALLLKCQNVSMEIYGFGQGMLLLGKICLICIFLNVNLLKDK